MRTLTFDISIPAERYEALYSGAVSDVQAVSREGLSVRFPGRILQKFVNHQGIHGTFEIEFDSANKFKAIKKIV